MRRQPSRLCLWNRIPPDGAVKYADPLRVPCVFPQGYLPPRHNTLS